MTYDKRLLKLCSSPRRVRVEDACCHYHILTRSPLPSHARAQTPPLYSPSTVRATVSGAYIVFMLTLTRPVARLATRNTARPLRLIASSKGGTAKDGEPSVDGGKKRISMVRYPRRKVVLYATVQST